MLDWILLAILFKLTPIFQLARIRLHGFSEREISIVRALLMSEIESAFLERDQIQSTSLRDEYVQVNLNYILIYLEGFRLLSMEKAVLGMLVFLSAFPVQ